MTIKTFDANRVGGGTFQLKQDLTTGEYTVEEVGFVKLPELKLPEIDQAPFKLPETKPDDPTTDTPVDVGGVQTGGGGSGGEDNQQDFTGESMFKNIKKEATGGDTLMESAEKFSGQDTGITMEKLPSTNIQFAQEAYNQAKANYDNLSKKFTKFDTSVMGASGPGTREDLENLKKAEDQMKQADNIIQDYKMQYATSFPTQIKDAPIGDFSQGPKTVPTGTLTGGLRGVPDAIVQGQPALPDENIITKAKDVVSNSKPVQLLGIGIRTAGKVIGGALEAITPELTNTQKLNNSLFKTRGDLGSSTDPGRLAGNPSVDLFAGMNKVSAKGNLEKAGAKRIATRKATIAKKGIKSATNPNGVSQEFVDNTNNMEKELTDMQNHNNNENIKSYNKKKDVTPINQLNPNEMRNVAETGDPGGDPGGKIVCTMMNQRYGFGSFRNKIWLKFHKDYSPEYQKGYHKVFLPLVNIAKKEGMFNTIVRKILEHMGRHVTADMFQIMRNKKSNKLGRIYRKIFEPICYWLGGK